VTPHGQGSLRRKLDVLGLRLPFLGLIVVLSGRLSSPCQILPRPKTGQNLASGRRSANGCAVPLTGRETTESLIEFQKQTQKVRQTVTGVDHGDRRS